MGLGVLLNGISVFTDKQVFVLIEII